MPKTPRPAPHRAEAPARVCAYRKTSAWRSLAPRNSRRAGAARSRGRSARAMPPAPRAAVRAREARRADVRLEQHQPPARGEHARAFGQRGDRAAEMVEHVEEDDRAGRAVAEGEAVAAAGEVEP